MAARSTKTLAAQVKAWRGERTVREAAELLEMSKRTLDGIEQGRPFRYEHLLKLAMRALNQEETR